MIETMKAGVRVVLVAFVGIAAIGCAGASEVDDLDLDGDVELDEADMELQAPNALNPNALNPNALNPNALNPNALNPNALSHVALDTTELSSLAPLSAANTEGELARQLLRYTTRCALTPTQSVSVAWVDAAGAYHQEQYPGSLGLAPSWAQAPLDDEEDQRWVSACLAALTNWYGIQVIVSLRGSHVDLVGISTEEAATYTAIEGAFWGNVFGPTPALWACHNPGTAMFARARRRDCAAGHLEKNLSTGQLVPKACGMIQLAGDCSTLCEQAAAGGGHFPECQASGEQAPNRDVITTYLR
ncbi:hypothetical protein [Chondromyces crocatus]|uniref:Lipoprotein n=1 Tax=Chondromyces crocatus TaxID=52 RepID=A0A0K1E9D8_CHOCO|nr:hypothetical protein [Chondromyces crocatus]AKT37464.1 uncharacterized protein CMC5_016050 [Chondromyces crocatus]